MKKTLTLCKDDQNYYIKDGEQSLISIDLKKKTIQGKDIFEKIYKTIKRDEKIEVRLDGDETIKSQEEKTILGRLQELFKDIDGSINQTLSASKPE